MELEDVLLTEEMYMHLLELVKNEDTILVGISQKFAELTQETKKVLDFMKGKSDERKQQHGLEPESQDVKKMDHKRLPPKLK